MAENSELACIISGVLDLNNIDLNNPEEKATYLRNLKAFCVDIRSIAGTAFFIANNAPAGVAFYNEVQKANKNPIPKNPWVHATQSASMAMEMLGAANRVMEIIEELESKIMETENG